MANNECDTDKSFCIVGEERHETVIAYVMEEGGYEPDFITKKYKYCPMCRRSLKKFWNSIR